MRRILFLLPLLFALHACGGGEPSASGPAADATAEVDEATLRNVTMRQSMLKLLAYSYRPMALMARGNADFDSAVVVRNAERVAVLAGMFPELFGPDTRGANVETESLARIWEEPELFAEKHQALRDAAAALVAVSGSDDQEAVLTAVRDLGGRCGSCHDDFRVDD